MRLLYALLFALMLAGCGNAPGDPAAGPASSSDAVLSRSGELTVPLKQGWNGVGFQGALLASLQTAAASAPTAPWSPARVSPSSRAVSSRPGEARISDSAANLVADDTNGSIDAFRKDTQTGAIVRVSVSTAGTQGDATGAGPFISADGNLVGFESDATNMVADDTNGLRDVFVRNVSLGTTVILSRPQDGSQANAASLTDAGQGLSGACFTGDGLGVFFRSNASNLVNGDTNGFVDLFFRLVP